MVKRVLSRGYGLEYQWYRRILMLIVMLFMVYYFREFLDHLTGSIKNGGKKA